MSHAMDVEVSTPQPQTPASESHSAPDGTISGGVKTETATDAATAAATEVFAPISVDGAASAEGTMHRGVKYFCGRTCFCQACIATRNMHNSTQRNPF